MHAYRTWGGRLAVHRHVDIATIVEIETAQGPFPLAHVIHDADKRSAEDLTEEIRGVKVTPSQSVSGRLLERAGPAFARIPGAIETMYLIMARSPRIRQRTGTVAVTTVGMFAAGDGFAIAPLTLMSLQIVVGGMAKRARVIDEQVVVRDVLDITVSIDHNVVDGGPATRFAAHLREIMESAEVL